MDIQDVVSKYFKYGRTMGKVNRWNEQLDRYAIGSMGLRHLFKYPFKEIVSNPKLIVLTFHEENIAVIKFLIRIIELANLKFKTLSEALLNLGCI